MESNPYKINGPALISFSGGRTSGFMLWNIIQAHGGTLPKDVYVTFANTGKEAPETLDFVHEIEQKFGKDAGATFRKDSDNYIKLLDISKQPHYEEQDMFDEQMTCFCHD